MAGNGHERGRNVATNVAGTWPRKWAHWPRCNVTRALGHVVGHVSATLNVAEAWPERDRTATNVSRNVASNMAAGSQRTWLVRWRTRPEHGQSRWPRCWPRLRFFQHFSFFSDFFGVRCVCQSQTLFAQVRTLEIQIVFENTIFSSNFSKCKSSKSGYENHLIISNWLSNFFGDTTKKSGS